MSGQLERVTVEGVVCTVPARTGGEPTLMSNLDQRIDPEFEEHVAKGGVCLHAGWEFNGKVWKEGDTYFEEVWRYHQPIKVVSARSARKLMERVNDEFGWE